MGFARLMDLPQSRQNLSPVLKSLPHSHLTSLILRDARRMAPRSCGYRLVQQSSSQSWTQVWRMPSWSTVPGSAVSGGAPR